MACNDIRPTRKFVVYGGGECYRIPDDITVLPLLDLMHLLRDVSA